MIFYRICEGEFVSDDFGKYKSYGIVAYGSFGTPVRVIEDITTNKGAMEKLVSLCNDLELSLSHLDYVIEDFIG